MGYNTQLDLCWPVALQDDMLFDATIAVSRTAWVLAQGKNPSEDEFMLYHRGLAIQRLRQNIDSAKPTCREAVIFTIGRMISIAVSIPLSSRHLVQNNGSKLTRSSVHVK